MWGARPCAPTMPKHTLFIQNWYNPRGITVFSRPEPDQTPGFTENFNFSPN